ncbi:hypothetical protein CBR_g51496 [Chara braunii]|uniref:Rhodanese domain-containing protein n=1 Tax=Chara braunii TaxID=69332 RepID=A0A388K6P2_CHABU|nr:hypothetical protein CBR_g51496 [Chara braunii]|eukprot:GBG65613.1 hypothetical protein CBR_g51496 [Chara braunii]
MSSSILPCFTSTIGYRSGLFAQKLRKEDFDAVNVKGSILAWTQAGYPLVTGYDEHMGSSDLTNPQVMTKRVHVWSDKFCLQGEGYQPVTQPSLRIGIPKCTISGGGFISFFWRQVFSMPIKLLGVFASRVRGAVWDGGKKERQGKTENAERQSKGEQ